jgi:hypothetical protein
MLLTSPKTTRLKFSLSGVWLRAIDELNNKKIEYLLGNYSKMIAVGWRLGERKTVEDGTGW